MFERGKGGAYEQGVADGIQQERSRVVAVLEAYEITQYGSGLIILEPKP